MSIVLGVVVSTCLRTPSDSRATSATALAMNPNMKPVSAIPSDQPTRPPSDSRSEKAVDEPRKRWRGARLSLCGSTEAPASRRCAISTVAHVNRAIQPTNGKIASGRAPVSGRISSISSRAA